MRTTNATQHPPTDQAAWARDHAAYEHGRRERAMIDCVGWVNQPGLNWEQRRQRMRVALELLKRSDLVLEPL